jgi:hypothetical protein
VQVTGNQKDPIKVTVPAGTTRYVEDGSGNLVSDGTSTADEVIYADAASLVKARTC